jgi:hypothetical protein
MSTLRAWVNHGMREIRVKEIWIWNERPPPDNFGCLVFSDLGGEGSDDE